MYEEMEIEISKRYLEEVIAVIEEPIVILGGWAVYFIVNDKYKETTGREYIGSRDIDIGFKMKGEDLDRTAFARSYSRLVDNLGFKPLSFRLFKEIHAETGKVLENNEAKKIPSYQIFPMYVDLIVDTIPTGFKECFGFTPIDEELLRYVFEDEHNRIELEEFGKVIWVPTPDILLGTKIKSYPNRDKEHKSIKDLCDIAVLLLFTSARSHKGLLQELLGPELLEKFKNSLTLQELSQVAEIIAIDPAMIEAATLKITR